MQRPEFGRHITYKLFPFILRLISLLLLWFLPLRVFLHQLQTYIQTFFIRTIYIFARQICRRLLFNRDSFFFFFFRRLISELAEPSPIKIGHMLGSNCNLKMHVQNLEYLLPLQIGGHKTTYLRRLQLNGNLTTYTLSLIHI